MDLSIVVPAFDEEKSIAKLVDEIREVVDQEGYDWELIFIDDGSTDKTWKIVQELHAANPRVRGLRFQRNYGKAAALHTGFRASKGKVVMTMDADLQDRPKHIPEFYKMITEEGFDLVSGWKQKRKDPLSKTIPTKLYNGVNRMVSGIKLHDQNCGFKAYRSEVVHNIEIYGEMHRYIPVIANAAGFRNIGELKVEHIARPFGKTKYGLNRFLYGLLDLFSITFLTRFSKSPMHFFGFWGLLTFLMGGGVLFYLYLMKFLGMVGVFKDYYIGDRIPALFFGSTLFLLGVLLIFTGLLAEMIGRTGSDRNNYGIAESVGLKKEDDDD